MFGENTQNRGFARATRVSRWCPCLKGKKSAVREEVVVEYTRFSIGHSGDGGFFPIRCVRTKDWKLSINLFDVDEQYELRNDPEEDRNLID